MTNGKVIAGTRRVQTGKRPAGATEPTKSVFIVSCDLFRVGDLFLKFYFFPKP